MAAKGRPTQTDAQADLKGVLRMADVACFCGCLYSFDVGAGDCPRCGEYATVSSGQEVQQDSRTAAAGSLAEIWPVSVDDLLVDQAGRR